MSHSGGDLQSWTNELKVGLFVAICGALLAAGYVLTWDGVRHDEAAYKVTVIVPTADGLWRGSPVRLAGVEIGSIEEIAVVGSEAQLSMFLRAAYPIPDDSVARVGLLRVHRAVAESENSMSAPRSHSKPIS